MHLLMYLNLQFIAISIHDLHLLYKASLALDFYLLPRLFPKSCKAKRKHKQMTTIQQKAHTVLESV